MSETLSLGIIVDLPSGTGYVICPMCGLEIQLAQLGGCWLNGAYIDHYVSSHEH